jgi:hypothetical protein
MASAKEKKKHTIVEKQKNDDDMEPAFARRLKKDQKTVKPSK